MTDILDQSNDNDLEIFVGGCVDDVEANDSRFTERDLLGDDDEETDLLKHSNNVSSQNGCDEAAVVTSEAVESDLYDAAIEPSTQDNVLAPISSSKTSTISQLPALGLSSAATSGRRYCCYIGNMTWWTTDVDLQSLIISCGATDLIDIKFYENRNNGQSRGFALAVFTAESAVKMVMEKLPHKTLHGQQVVVLPYTKASLAKFEDATRSRDQQRIEKKENKKDEPKAPFVGTIRIGVPPQQQQPQIQTTPMAMPPPMSMRPQVQVPPPMANMRPPAQVPIMIPPQQPPQMRGPPPTSQPLNLANLNVATRPPVNLNAPPPGIPQVQIGGGGPPMSRPPPTFGQIPQNMPPMSTAGNPAMAGAPPTSHPPPSFPPPGAHINPQVYRQNFGSCPATVPSAIDGLTEAEFEEIMNRNRTVSSSAITRAVSDAAANDYASAIETLVTAISLIRQSRVANDDRCKVLISSLQDTLNGIESKSYNSSSRKHRSGRDRSRSPSDRSRKRHRRSSRSRSRSRERYDYSPRHSSSNRRAY